MVETTNCRLDFDNETILDSFTLQESGNAMVIYQVLFKIHFPCLSSFLGSAYVNRLVKNVTSWQKRFLRLTSNVQPFEKSVLKFCF